MKERPGCLLLLELSCGVAWLGLIASIGCCVMAVQSKTPMLIAASIAGAVQAFGLAALFHSLIWIVNKLAGTVAQESNPATQDDDGIADKPVLKRRKYSS